MFIPGSKGNPRGRDQRKATLIILHILIVSLLNAVPIEENQSKNNNSKTELRKQLIQTLEKRERILMLNYTTRRIFLVKDSAKEKCPCKWRKISGNYVKFGIQEIYVDKGWSKKKYVFSTPYIKEEDGVEIYYRPDATISERHWWEKGIFKKAESYDTNGKWDWRRDEDGKSYFNN